MADLFTIPERAYDGLTDLIDIGLVKLEQLGQEVGDRQLTLDVAVLAKDLADAIGFDPDRIERTIYAVLIPLSGLRADFGMTPAQFLKQLEKLLERQNPDWYKTHQAEWAKVAPAVGELIAPNGYFGHLRKAFELLANHPRLVRGIKILTELRPVYDDEVTMAKAMLLTSTLVLDYNDGGKAKCIHLTLDQQDLRVLQQELDRAEKKIQLLEEQAGKLGVAVLVAGAE